MSGLPNQVAGSFAPVVRDLRFSGSVVTKRATVGRDKLVREYAWLADIPPRWRSHFPKLLGLRQAKDWAEYDMEWCRWPNLADLMVRGPMTGQELQLRINAILSFMREELWVHETATSPPDYFRTSYLDKFLHRRRAGREISALFDAMTDCETLVINGVAHQSATVQVEDLLGNPSTLGALRPPRVATFHGDFKPDNILVGPRVDQFMLLDPRGATATGALLADTAEDLAKFRTSTRSLYDLARVGAFEVRITLPRIDFRLRSHHDSAERFAVADGRFVESLVAYADVASDPTCRARMDAIEALLLLANAPFQLVDSSRAVVQLAVLLHVVGLQRLAEARR